MKLILLGAPGAGKGTQAEKICAAFDIAHISTGDMLRQEIREGTELGLKAKGVMEAGGLVSDDVILGMVQNRTCLPDCQNGFLFDGFPRTIAQADALCALTDIDAAINIDVPEERLLARMCGRRICRECGATYHISRYSKDTCEKCGGALYTRDDDREETVKNRIDVYTRNTQPLIDYYEAKGVLRTVDGDRSPDEVFADVKLILESL
jgi:adenylate kinase